jgi:hypothetical protein
MVGEMIIVRIPALNQDEIVSGEASRHRGKWFLD